MPKPNKIVRDLVITREQSSQAIEENKRQVETSLESDIEKFKKSGGKVQKIKGFCDVAGPRPAFKSIN